MEVNCAKTCSDAHTKQNLASWWCEGAIPQRDRERDRQMIISKPMNYYMVYTAKGLHLKARYKTCLNIIKHPKTSLKSTEKLRKYTWKSSTKLQRWILPDVIPGLVSTHIFYDYSSVSPTENHLQKATDLHRIKTCHLKALHINIQCIYL